MPVADYSQVKNMGFLVPPGKYIVRIVKAEFSAQPDKAGNHYTQVKYEILDGSDKTAVGAPLTDFIPYTGPRAWKHRSMATVLNQTRTEGQPEFIEGGDFTADHFINRELEIEVALGSKKDATTGVWTDDATKRQVVAYLPYVAPSDIPADFENFAKSLG